MPKFVHGLRFTVHGIKETVNCQLSTVNYKVKQGGYTLVEFIVVLGLLSIAVGSTLLFLTSVLKGSNQSNITVEVKQNGQVVLDSLERRIRSASDVAEVGSDGDHIKIVSPDSSLPMHIRCFNPVAGTSNGWIGTAMSADDEPSDPSYTEMTNRDAISGISVDSCTFNVYLAATTAPPVVSVNFTLSQAINAPSRQDYQANVEFRTTISLRRY